MVIQQLVKKKRRRNHEQRKIFLKYFIGYTLLGSAVAFQFAILLDNFFEFFLHDDPLTTAHMGYVHMLDGLFCAGAVMISYGAVLGYYFNEKNRKIFINSCFVLLLLILEKLPQLKCSSLLWLNPFFFFVNFFINVKYFGTLDIGGGYYIHLFGAVTGLMATKFLTSKDTRGHDDNTNCYSSDIFSFTGCIFLMVLWPSFNAAVATDEGRYRATVNTWLSLMGSIVSTFTFTRLLDKERKFDVVHIQNATLAGGVMMGIVGDLNLKVGVALVCGWIGGAASTLSYVKFTPFLSKKFNIQDVCGVGSLHGL